MKKVIIRFVVVLFLILNQLSAHAQLPCQNGPDGLIYIQGSVISNYNPALPISPTNPVTNTIPLAGGGGLAVANNLNGPGPSPTFYSVSGNNYVYWNGVTWINTGHAAGPGTGYVNPGGGGNFIYNYTSGGNISKYDGTGPATLLLNIPGLGGGGPFDVVGDCDGGFYVLRTEASSTPAPFLRKYNSNGVLVQSWTATGTSNSAGGGFAIIGNTVYYHNGGGFRSGQISNSSSVINFAPNPAVIPSPSDMACCPVCLVNKDTLYYCENGTPLTLSTSNSATSSWTLVSGNATLSSNIGSSIQVTATTTSIITAVSNSNLGTDSFVVIPVTANLDAGANYTIAGCGTYTDTLNGTLLNLNPSINYTIAWQPTANILNGGNTMTPGITQTGITTYSVSVSSDAAQGSCLWIDSITVDVEDFTPIASFTYDANLGCENDTVIFTNTSTLNPNGSPNYLWDFGDINFSTQASPTHIYGLQNIYNVTLTVNDNGCSDAITIPINLVHPIDADFSITNNGIPGGPSDSICLGSAFLLSAITVPLAAFNVLSIDWYISDGTQYLNAGPFPKSHIFSNPGIYNIKLVVTDSIGCKDSITKSVFVDQPPYVQMSAQPTEICVGEIVHFTDSVALNTFGWTYNFGDGNILRNVHNPSHTYSEAGNYIATFRGIYLVCPDDSVSVNIVVNDFPLINLGEDTSYCPGLTNGIKLSNKSNSSAILNWSNGESSPNITVQEPGYYWASSSNGTCTSTDSVWIRRNCYLNIPNSFSPSGDGLNDYFFPRQLLSSGLTEFSMKVFNRWGEIVFETTSLNGLGWDGRYGGKEQPMGVYVYLIEAKWLNGFKNTFQGNVTLLR